MSSRMSQEMFAYGLRVYALWRCCWVLRTKSPCTIPLQVTAVFLVCCCIGVDIIWMPPVFCCGWIWCELPLTWAIIRLMYSLIHSFFHSFILSFFSFLSFPFLSFPSLSFPFLPFPSLPYFSLFFPFLTFPSLPFLFLSFLSFPSFLHSVHLSIHPSINHLFIHSFTLSFIHPFPETSHHTSDAVLELRVLGGVDERVDAAVAVHQYNAEVIEPEAETSDWTGRRNNLCWWLTIIIQ